jgi:hypothetical protein
MWLALALANEGARKTDTVRLMSETTLQPVHSLHRVQARLLAQPRHQTHTFPACSSRAMGLVDDLISETESLLQSLRAVEYDIDSSSRQRVTLSTLYSRSASAALVRQPDIENCLSFRRSAM